MKALSLLLVGWTNIQETGWRFEKMRASSPPVESRHEPMGLDRSITNRGIRDAVVAGLAHFATGTTLEMLIYLLEEEHSVDFNFIAENPAILRSGLSKMFGSAEEVVEARICQALNAQFQIEGKSLEELISRIKSSNILIRGT